MKKGFTTKLIEEKNDNKVIVYGLNKVYCNGCTLELQHLQTVFACRHASCFTDRPNDEYRDLNCVKCMSKKKFYCDKADVNHVYGQHIDVKSCLFICPVGADLDVYTAEVTKA